MLSIERQFVRTERPLYSHLVALLENAIAKGDLPSGSRVPPERALAQQLKISRTTVVSAYRELESRGLLRGYVGRGTFVCAAPEPEGTPFAWRGKIAAAALRSSDTTLRDVVRHSSDARLLSLAAGEPALDQFPTEAYLEATRHVLSSDPSAVWGHGPTEGQPALKSAIADRYNVPRESVLVLSGAQQGLDLLARCLIDPGDAVIMDRPGYLGAIQSFRAAGAKLIGWDISRGDTDELEDLLVRYRPKLIFTNPTFHNPTATTVPIRTRREILSLAQRYRVPIVEDATYRDLYFTEAPPPFSARSRRAQPRHLLEQFLEGDGAGTAPRVDRGGAVDHRSDRDHQAAARPAHAEPGAVRHRAPDAPGDFRRAPAHDPRGARPALHADDCRAPAPHAAGVAPVLASGRRVVPVVSSRRRPQRDRVARARARQRRHVRARPGVLPGSRGGRRAAPLLHQRAAVDDRGERQAPGPLRRRSADDGVTPPKKVAVTFIRIFATKGDSHLFGRSLCGTELDCGDACRAVAAFRRTVSCSTS
jgi:DNA-binding transcriptional regulator YhcF (GntR family)